MKWRPETQHQLLDAMSRVPNKSNVIEDLDDSFPSLQLHRSFQWWSCLTVGEWLHEVLREPCETWPRGGDDFVQPVLWIHCTTPDLRLPGKPTPFCPAFGRDARTQFDATHPEIDGGDSRGGMHNYVADKHQTYKEVRDVRVALLKIHEDRQKSRESRNAEIGQNSVGTSVVVGDKVPVKEAESVMAREGTHHKLAHEHWTLGGD